MELPKHLRSAKDAGRKREEAAIGFTTKSCSSSFGTCQKLFQVGIVAEQESFGRADPVLLGRCAKSFEIYGTKMR